MNSEIQGSFAVKKSGISFRSKRFRLIFTRDRLFVAAGDRPVSDYIDENRSTIERTDILSSDDSSFELFYHRIQEVDLKEGGFGRTGTIAIDSYGEIYKYDIAGGEDYRSCVSIVKSVLGEKCIDRSQLPAVRYCPECGSEFQDWVTVCPDCGVALVDEPPEIVKSPERQKSNMLSYIDTDMLENAMAGLSAEEMADIADTGDLADDTMVSIAVAPNEMVAKMWQGLLSEQGIPCMIQRTGFNGLTMNPKYQTPFTGDFEILVLLPHVTRASAILEPFMDA